MAKSKNTAPALSRADLRSAVVTAGAAALAIPGFAPAGDFKAPDGAIVNAMSPLVRPKDFPVGQVYTGRFTKIFETNPGKGDDGEDKVGEGVEFVPDGANVGIALPAVATLRLALKLTGKGAAATSEYLGRIVSVQKMENRLKSKKGQDAWHFVACIHPADR